MLFGVREIANVTFKALSEQKIGSTTFKKNQPVLHIDTAKTSSLEQAATTVYAQGGRGNARLIAWEGEKTLTFTIEDALLSTYGLSILSGADLIKTPEAKKVNMHVTTRTTVSTNEIDLTNALNGTEVICNEPGTIFVILTDEDGSLTGDIIPQDNLSVSEDGKKIIPKTGSFSEYATKNVLVDYYVVRTLANTGEIQIGAENFAGNYYIEADTLFRRQSDGVDMPATITIPNAKIQSNFTFSMASTGDPSTFTFTIDAFPGYTMFDKSNKVLCVIQVAEDYTSSDKTVETVMPHPEDSDTSSQATVG
jgi:hypothetical protein